jgi:transposase
VEEVGELSIAGFFVNERWQALVHTQRGLCVMGYSSFHETSNICPEIVGKGARKPPSGAALQGDLRPSPLPDTARQRPRPLAAQDSRKPRVRLAETVRNAIRAFNEKGLDALIAGSSTPKRVYPAFDANSAERLRGMLHRSPREFGYESSLWTLEMAAEAAFEEGLTEKRVSGETIRATLSRLLGISWQRAKRWITSPDPLYERKKASFASDRLMEIADADPLWAIGFLDECWWSRVALPTLSAFSEEGEPPRMIQQSVAKDDPDPKAISCYGLYLPRLDYTCG